MTSAQRLGTPLPVGSTVIPGTLRAKMEEQRARGALCSLRETIAIIVPLAVEIADRHLAGEMLYVHPSSIVVDEATDRAHIAPELALRPPTLPRDKVCMAPEEREGKAGNARSSVYAIGAIAYELLTNGTVGPGMRRPTEVVPDLPKDVEVILAKALVADPVHRPDDLKALAQAIHHLAPTGSLAPPPADESHLDHDDNFSVDVSLSMLPPAPSQIQNEIPSPYDMTVSQSADSMPRASDSTNELAVLKARLERDKRPRYVVIKDGMDHGPFASVELLQQIASHTFVEGDILRDAFSKDERAIKDWEEFAPFAEHARLHRDIKAEKEALERTVVAERKSTTSKALIGVLVAGAIVTGFAIWFVAKRGSKSDQIAVHGELSTNVESDAGLKVQQRKTGGKGGGVVGVSNGIPILAGGMSCEGAIAAYKGDEMTIGGPKGQADITAGQYGAILNRGNYFGHCGAPGSMEINICAAVQNGRAVGVSVVTNPRNPSVASCIAGGVRGLSFPSRPNLDVTRTVFK